MPNMRTPSPVPFRFEGKLLVIRHSRLRRVPPAWNATEILLEKGFPVLVAEFGAIHEKKSKIESEIPRIRIANPWASLVPKVLQPLAIFFGAFLSLSWKMIRTGRPRLLVAHGLQEELLALGLGSLFRIPYAIHAHEIYDRSDLSTLNRLFLSWEGLAFRKAAFVIFPERNRARLYRSRHRFEARSFLVYNCPRKIAEVKPQDLRKLYSLPADSKLIGYWGGVGELNAIEEGIRSLCLLPHYYFLIWGWGEKSYLDRLTQIARDVGVADRVLFKGQMPTMDSQANKWGLLAGLDVGYCLYNPNENLRARYQATASNKLMEAIAVGLPVISSSSFDFKKIVEGEKVGICSVHLTPAAIAGAIRELSRDDEELARKQVRARRLHEKEFHYEEQFKGVSQEFAKYFKLKENIPSSILQTAPPTPGFSLD